MLCFVPALNWNWDRPPSTSSVSSLTDLRAARGVAPAASARTTTAARSRSLASASALRTALGVCAGPCTLRTGICAGGGGAGGGWEALPAGQGGQGSAGALACFRQEEGVRAPTLRAW